MDASGYHGLKLHVKIKERKGKAINTIIINIMILISNQTIDLTTREANIYKYRDDTVVNYHHKTRSKIAILISNQTTDLTTEQQTLISTEMTSV